MTKKEAIFKLVNSEISLKDIPEFNDDKEIVKAAVVIDGYSLKFASEELRNDKEIAMIAVSENGLALQYASEDLKNNLEVVCAAVSKQCHALQFASEELKNNKLIKEISADSKYFIQFLWDESEYIWDSNQGHGRYLYKKRKVIAEGPLITERNYSSSYGGIVVSIYKINIYDIENQTQINCIDNYVVYKFDQYGPYSSGFREDFDQKFEKLSRSIEFIKEFEKKFIVTSWIEDKLTWDSENRILTIL